MSADFGRSRVPGDILRDGMPGDMFRGFRSTKVDCQFAAHLQPQQTYASARFAAPHGH